MMGSAAGWLGRDERGTNTVGLAMIVLVLLILLAAATEFGSAFVGLGGHQVGDAGNVAAQQQQAFQSSFAASRGAGPGPQHAQVRMQQQSRMAVAAQSGRAPTSQQVRGSLASMPGRWAKQVGVFLFETVPEDVRNLVVIFRTRARQLIE